MGWVHVHRVSDYTKALPDAPGMWGELSLDFEPVLTLASLDGRPGSHLVKRPDVAVPPPAVTLTGDYRGDGT
ncbi:MAG: hypothetical protein PVF45_07340 [Anaerolineae bacterium]